MDGEIILSRAMVVHDDAVELCYVNDEHFKDAKNRLIYRAIRELVEVDGKKVDQISVSQKLAEWEKLEEAGGAFNVARIAGLWDGRSSVNDLWIERVKKSIDLIDLISETVTLSDPSGKGNYIGKCPMCGTKKLNVSRSHQIYKCFTCTGGGNSLWWLCETRPMSFHDILRYLAGKAEIELPEVLR